MTFWKLFFTTFILTSASYAQNFDTSANGSLTGTYFIREVLITGQNTDATLTSAGSVIGSITFDGKGNYTFSGQSANSSSGPSNNVSFNGTYQLAANGLLTIQSMVDGNDYAYGGVSAIGPSAFVASATEGTNVDMIVAIPAGPSATNATFTGKYSAGYIDFLNADITMIREATFSATADGAGNLGSVPVAGTAANLGGSPTTQVVSGVTYSLVGQSGGTLNFGATSSSQLISGSKNFYVSADGNIMIGGSPTGFDMLVGIRALSGNATNSTVSGDYFLAGLEDYAGGGKGTDAIDGYYGAVNATGTGAAIFHNRLQSFASSVYDYTYDSQYTVSSGGSFAPSDLFYQFTLGANGKAVIATGTAGYYSLVVGLGAPVYQGGGVYLNPLGVVNAANFAPITNPVAPNEFVALYGSGLAGSTIQAPGLPLPTSLGGVQVTVNGISAPLFYVSPGQIAILMPSAISPANGVYYATIQVTNNGTPSNSVTVYTSNTAPGVFSQGGNGIGPAAAQRPDYSLITSNNPAKTGETVILYLGGVGSVTPAVADGGAAPSNPPSTVTAKTGVDFGGTNANVSFAGLTPGLAGLYQMNVVVPSGTTTGAFFTNITTPDAYASESTVTITDTGKLKQGAASEVSPALPGVRRPAPSANPKVKSEGLRRRRSGIQ